MRRRRYSEEDIVDILRQRDLGRSVADLCVEYQISTTTYYAWRERYRFYALTRDEQLQRLEVENARLKKLVFNLTIERNRLSYITGQDRRNNPSGESPETEGTTAQ